jgi:hypothetical protein
MPALFAWLASACQRQPSGTQNTPARLYSSLSPRNASSRDSGTPSASTSSRICARRSSNESETYLRKTRPRTKSLYCAASIDPRSLSAAFQSVSRRSAIVGMPGSATWTFFFGGMSSPSVVR